MLIEISSFIMFGFLIFLTSVPFQDQPGKRRIFMTSNKLFTLNFYKMIKIVKSLHGEKIRFINFKYKCRRSVRYEFNVIIFNSNVKILLDAQLNCFSVLLISA